MRQLVFALSLLFLAYGIQHVSVVQANQQSVETRIIPSVSKRALAKVLLALPPRTRSQHLTSTSTVDNNAKLVTPFHDSRRSMLWSTFSILCSIGALSPALAITRYHKSKPELGVVLVEEVRASGGLVSAEVILNKGVLATIAFESSWPLAKSVSVDVETSTKKGESAFLQVEEMRDTETFATLPKSWFTNALSSVKGRFGAYGEPTGMQIKEFVTDAPGRSFELSFDVLTPAASELRRKGVMRALQAPGSSDVLMLICSADEKRWGEVATEAKSTVASLSIASTRSTGLKRDPSVDYRYSYSGELSGPESVRSR